MRRGCSWRSEMRRKSKKWRSIERKCGRGSGAEEENRETNVMSGKGGDGWGEVAVGEEEG
jgi:hypothetical protein